MWKSIRSLWVRFSIYLEIQFLNPRLLPVCLASIAFIALVAIIAYLPVTKSGLIDIAQLVGQAITVITFVFAVYQYRKTREAARISYISKEADSLIPAMSECINSLDLKSKTFLDDLFKVIGRLVNLGTDFSDFYGHLPQCIERRIVGSHWQNMFLDDLAIKFGEIKIAHIIDHRQREDVLCKLMMDINPETLGTDDLLDPYNKALLIFRDPKFFLENMPNSVLRKNTSTVYLFKSQYFDRKNTQKMANNSWFGTDMRVRAPVLAAFYEARMNPVEIQLGRPLW